MVKTGTWSTSARANGTFVNGKRASGDTLLMDGDQLQVGCTLFTVSYDSADMTVAGNVAMVNHDLPVDPSADTAVGLGVLTSRMTSTATQIKKPIRAIRKRRQRLITRNGTRGRRRSLRSVMRRRPRVLLGPFGGGRGGPREGRCRSSWA